MRLPQSIIIHSLFLRRLNLLTIGAAILLFGTSPVTAGAANLLIASTPANLRFGTTVVGQTKTQLVSVTNTGGTSLTISGVTSGNPAFITSNLSLPVVVDVGQSVTLNVSFTPTEIGWTGGTIKFFRNTSTAPVYYLQVEGSGRKSEAVTASPSFVSFGQVAAGTSSTAPVVLTNALPWGVGLLGMTTTGTGFSVQGPAFPMVLGAGQSVTLNVAFAPQSAGTAGGSLIVSGPGLAIPLTGTGTGSAPGQLQVAPVPLNFGNMPVGTTKTQPLTLSATGGGVTVSSASSSSSQFMLQGASFPVTIAAGQAVSLNVAFTPQSSGTVSGSLSFVSNASNSQLLGPNPSTSVPLSGTGVTAGILATNPTSLPFGNVQVGNSTSLSGTLTNSGGSSLTISSANASGGGFSLNGLGLPLTLAAGQSTSFTVLFNPTASGAAGGSVNITSTASNSSLSIPLSGTGVTQGALGASPTSLAFGSVQTGTSQSLPATLTNSGGSSLTISAATASGGGFSLNGLALPLTLAAGQSTSFTVLFNPTASGAASGSVNITSTASNSSLSIPLSGTGVTPGTLAANPASLAFGSVQLGNSTTLSETLTNSGGSSLTISAANAGGTGFSLSGLGLPLTLAAGQSTSFSVLFNPAASGAASGSITITSTGSVSNLSIPLSGTAVTQGTVGASPTSLAFGNVQVGNSTSLSETLTNSGGSSLTISAATASGGGFSLSGLGLPLTLAAGQSTSFTVLFNPTASGAVSGSVNITSTASDSSLSIPLSGTGVTQGALGAAPTSLAFGSIQTGTSQSLPATLTNSGGSSLTISAATASGGGFSLSGLGLPLTLAAGQSTSFIVLFNPTASGAVIGNVNITSTASNSNLSIPLSGTGVTQGALGASPTSLAFGSIQTGTSQSLPATLTNSGGSSLTISAATASGGGFSLSGLGLPLTLTAGQSTSFTVLFNPTASGAVSGSVNITSTASNSSLSIPLSGTGVTPGTLAATSLVFGSVQVGNSANLSETLTNTGGSAVNISQANLTGAAFSLSGLTLPLSLAPNQSVTFTTTFTPTGAGAASGTLSVVSDASNSPVNITLSGTGGAPGQLAVSPTSLSFGNLVVGSSSSLSGSLTASGASVTITSAGINNGEFVLSGLSFPVTLAAGQSTPFTVTFTPQASGATSASLSFSSNASNSSASQSMTGTGTAPIQHSVDLTWTGSANAVGYNIYRSNVSGGPYTLINTSLDGTTAYTDNTVVSGQTYYYVTAAVDGNSDVSGYSNQTQAVIPNP